MTYTHLTQAERYRIEILRKATHTQSEIAVLLGGVESTANQRLPFGQPTARREPREHLPAHLTLCCQEERKKRHTGRARRGSIPNQVSIDLRPAVVVERARFGDWETDLVIGAGQKQALVTFNERISRHSLIAHIPFKTAELVSQAMIALLKPFSMCVHALTTDNGREFAQRERIAATLGADFFFAHPYSSWERGANGNMSELIRQFFPKKMAFELIVTEDIELAMHRLNHRPRKCLGYRTPYEVFMEQLQLHNELVALQT